MKDKILEIITQHKFDHINSEQAISELLDLFIFSDDSCLSELQRNFDKYKEYKAKVLGSCERDYELKENAIDSCKEMVRMTQIGFKYI